MSRFYVTTPIYYVNDVPHIGHAYTTVAADVLTRWHRLLGDEVFFLTGTDEHGLKIQRAAEAQGLLPSQLVATVAGVFREEWNQLDIAYDDFIRTTEPRHYKAVQEFLQLIYDAGDIELGVYEGLYCVSCELYYSEDELVLGNCPIHDRPVEHVTEENYFFKLSRYGDRLLEYYTEHPEAVQPESRRNEVLGLIRTGLQDFSISRTSITWGVPLPWDPKHVAYVWADALFNYCTAVGFGDDGDRFAKWWPVDYHLIGKDILRQHAVYWPAMLMSAGIEPPKCVFAHGWLLVSGEKMSKTKTNQIAPADLVADFGVDGFRYHFMADQRFGPDGDFSYEAMVQRYNADLANNFGNLANRVLNMAVNYCGGVTPATRENGPLADAAATAYAGMAEAMDKLDFATAFLAVWDLIRAANAFIEDRAPWKLNKAGETEAVAGVIGDCLETLRIVALLASPVIPRASAELWRRLGLPGRPEDQRVPEAAAWGLLPAGSKLEKGDPLFPRKETEPEPWRWLREMTSLQLELGATRFDADDADAQVQRAREAGIDWMVCVGTGLETSQQAIDLAAKYDDVYATVGLHPHDASALDAEWDGLVALADTERCVAIGEAGFDLHYEHSPRDEQEVAFRRHIQLAKAVHRPLMIHSRNAWDDTFRLLDEEGVPERTIFHCFTGGPDEARKALDRDCYLSFSGIVSFKAADDVRAAAALAPSERVLVETDSPYLAPAPNRGKPNEPAWVALVGAALAAARGVEPDDIAALTRANAARVFGVER